MIFLLQKQTSVSLKLRCEPIITLLDSSLFDILAMKLLLN